MRQCKELQRDPPAEPSGDSDEEDPEQSSDDEFDAQETLDDWMLTLRLEQRKMLSVTLMESFKSRQKMNVKEAATEAGLVHPGINVQHFKRL